MDVSRSEVTHSYFQVYYFMNYVNGKARLRCIHNIKSKTILYLGLLGIARLNSGIKNRLNFLAWAIYIFQKVVSDSVNHADSEDIKILIQFPGKSIFENFAQFLKKRGRHQ